MIAGDGDNRMRLDTRQGSVSMGSEYRWTDVSDYMDVKPSEVAFDRAHLIEHTMQSPELEREIIDLFLKQLPELLGGLLKSKTPEDWRFQTHTLKGSALAVGACKIGDLARMLEQPQNAKPCPTRTKMLHQLQIAVAEFEHIASRTYGI
jgi:HPt (histidine-containing phosphotransfer) domain-containing protein